MGPGCWQPWLLVREGRRASSSRLYKWERPPPPLLLLPMVLTVSPCMPRPLLPSLYGCCCRCLDSLGPLLVHLFAPRKQTTSAAAAAADGCSTPRKPHTKPQQQQQQQQQEEEAYAAVSVSWRQLRGSCYGLLNQLVECSCVGSDQQLLVVPTEVTEALQSAVAEEGVLTGGWVDGWMGEWVGVLKE
jgi:hypothetical protein